MSNAVRDRDDLLLLPNATHVLGEVIANWWGAHQWLYDNRSSGLWFGDHSEPLVGTIRQIVDRLEHHCRELRDGVWWWHEGADLNGTTRGATWSTREITVRFSLGERVTVRYQPCPASRSDQSDPQETTQSFTERVAFFDRASTSDAIAVWFRYPDDVGSTLQELLACPAPAEALPRRLCLLLDREVHIPVQPWRGAR